MQDASGSGFAAAVAVLCLAVAAGCGGDGSEPAAEPRAAGAGEMRVGSVAALAQCRDWRGADASQRRATIADIRSAINVRDTPTPTPALNDAQAARVFDRACAPRYAAGFRLYKLYARAAAFQDLPKPGLD